MVELINLDKEENHKINYPSCVRTEGIAPSQYGTKGLVDKRLAEMEEKYDLQPEALKDGFGEQSEDGTSVADSEADEFAEDNSEANDGF